MKEYRQFMSNQNISVVADKAKQLSIERFSPNSLNFIIMSSPKRTRVCTDFYRNTKNRTASTKALNCNYGKCTGDISASLCTFATISGLCYLYEPKTEELSGFFISGSERRERMSKRLQNKVASKRTSERLVRIPPKSGSTVDQKQTTFSRGYSSKKNIEASSQLKKITTHFPRRKSSNGYCHVKAVPDELLLQIFSFLQADDLCRVSQVCTRFAAICQDEALWKQLYVRVFDMKKPLMRTAEGLIVSQDAKSPSCWKQSLKMLHNAHHVYQKEFKANDGKHYNTIQEAIDNVPDNSFILVHGGQYRESLTINKPVFIIGVAFGDVGAVEIENCIATAINFETGSSGAILGHLTVKHTVNASSQYSKHGCIEISGECSPIMFNCRLTSLSHAGATIYAHGKGARPVVSNCTISDSENVGIFVTDGAQGLYEDCEITNTKLAGVWVRSHANPIMRRNHVHHGRDVGFFIFDQGLGYYEKNDIHNNRIAGLEVRSWANPTVVACSIHHGMTGGIYCHDDARGEFLENKIYSNKYAGIWITSQSNPTIKNNEIYDGQQGGVYIFGEGRGLIESNNIHDNALAGIQIRTKSNPIVRCNKIHSGLHGGIYIHEGGQGLIEENEIFSNTLAGVWITTGSSPTLRYNRIHSGKQVGVYFYDGGCGTLEENDIFNHKYSGIQIRSSSNPLIRRNKIWGGQNGGVLVYNEGMGLLEENEIFDNAMAGVWIKTESNPVLRKNKIHDGREGGICIFNGGKGVLEENEIFRNTLTGVLISTSSFPVLKNNRIYDGGAAGIEITNGAGGVLEDNEVFNNRFDGICLATGVKPKLKNNKVYSNQGEVENAVHGGLCLFQVSGNSCYPMHDFYKCNTCGTTDGFAICVSCVTKCHQGHNVSFVRHDRFFCDCGAGSTGIKCKLTGESSRKSCLTRHEHTSLDAEGAEEQQSEAESTMS